MKRYAHAGLMLEKEGVGVTFNKKGHFNFYKKKLKNWYFVVKKLFLNIWGKKQEIFM